MAFLSYAQNNEDVLLNRVFGGQQIGFYVDIGAYHPVDGSVTKAFYDRGWSGINLEPGSVFDVLAAERPRDVNLRMAVLDRKGEVAFVEDSADAGMSHVVDGTDGLAKHSVPCDTLEAIVADYAKGRPIDFIKVDAEGAEGAIIRSTDWRRLRPRVLLFEATRPWSSEFANEEWEPVLLAAGFIRAYFDGINCFYVPEEHWPIVACHFQVPVNVLDAAISNGSQVVRLQAEVAKVREVLSQAERDLARLVTSNNTLQLERDQLRGGLMQTTSERDTILAEAAAMRARIAQLDAAAQAAQAAEQAAAAVHTVAQATASPPRTLLRRMALAAYAVVRPIVRPIIWRLRGFLLGPTLAEIGHVQAQLRQIAAMPSSPPADLRGVPEEFERRLGSPGLPDPQLHGLAKAMEDAMLTLAITTQRSPGP